MKIIVIVIFIFLMLSLLFFYFWWKRSVAKSKSEPWIWERSNVRKNLDYSDINELRGSSIPSTISREEVRIFYFNVPRLFRYWSFSLQNEVGMVGKSFNSEDYTSGDIIVIIISPTPRAATLAATNMYSEMNFTKSVVFSYLPIENYDKNSNYYLKFQGCSEIMGGDMTFKVEGKSQFYNVKGSQLSTVISSKTTETPFNEKELNLNMPGESLQFETTINDCTTFTSGFLTGQCRIFILNHLVLNKVVYHDVCIMNSSGKILKTIKGRRVTPNVETKITSVLFESSENYRVIERFIIDRKTREAPDFNTLIAASIVKV